VPTLIVHDREDNLVELSQATAAYSLLSGEKRLYIAQSSALPEAQVIAWFKRYLASGPPAGKGVVLQHAQPDSAATTFRGLPPSRFVSVNLPGAALKRSVRLPGGPLETFGGGSVTIRYSGASWQQVVATVSTAKGTVVTEGAAAVAHSDGVLKIPLLDEVALLPRGKKLVVTLASHDATFGGTTSGTISVGRLTLKLSVLTRAVSH
jgi:hypothetical protein